MSKKCCLTCPVLHVEKSMRGKKRHQHEVGEGLGWKECLRERGRLGGSSTATSSTPGSSGSGSHSTGMSAPARPSPGEVDHAVEVSPDLDLPGRVIVQMKIGNISHCFLILGQPRQKL